MKTRKQRGKKPGPLVSDHLVRRNFAAEEPNQMGPLDRALQAPESLASLVGPLYLPQIKDSDGSTGRPGRLSKTVTENYIKAGSTCGN